MSFPITTGPLSKDIEDRRNKPSTWWDRAKSKVQQTADAVKDDYNDAKQHSEDKTNPMPVEDRIKKIGDIPSYKKGGKVHKTGLAHLHKGERVIPKSKVHKVEKAMRKVSRKRG